METLKKLRYKLLEGSQRRKDTFFFSVTMPGILTKETILEFRWTDVLHLL
jgi:hypothetical protein